MGNASQVGSAEQKRVLLLAESPYFGGITSHLLSILDGFERRRDFEFVLATLPGRREDATLLDWGRSHGVPVDVLPMAWAYDIRVLEALRQFVRDKHIHLIHTHNYRATLIAALARTGVPAINTFHLMVTEPSVRLKTWQWAELHVMRRHPLTIACCDFVREWLVAKGHPARKVRTVHNAFAPPDAVGVGNASYPPQVPVDRGELDIPDNRLVVLYVGRLVERKGVHILLEALRGLSNVTAVIVGDGPMRSRLEEYARAVGVDVRFVGRRDDPGRFYPVADVVALPSSVEGLPMGLVEAAAYGKPCVATAVGGTPEVVRDGETGILVPYGDVEALRAALIRFEDATFRAEMGRRAKALWEAHFTPARLAQDLANAYRDVLAQ